MYVAILNNEVEGVRIYENLAVLNADLDMNPYTLTNFFSRNKGEVYKRGRLTVVKTPLIDRKFIKALYDTDKSVKSYKLNQEQRTEVLKRKKDITETKDISWSI